MLDENCIDGLTPVTVLNVEILGTHFKVSFYRTHGTEEVNPLVFYRYFHLWIDAGRPDVGVFHVGPFMKIEVIRDI